MDTRGKKKDTPADNKDDDNNLGIQCPDGVNPSLWDLMMSIKGDTQETRVRLETLEGKVSTLEDQSGQHDTDLHNLQSSVKLLSARLSRSETHQSSLQQELYDLQCHSMKENLIFTFDQDAGICKEIRGEDCATTLRAFMGEHMSIPDTGRICIQSSHRLGPFKPGQIRPIIAKIPFANQRQTILQHSNRLEATNRRSNTKHFVTRQTPAAMTERNQFALPAFNQAKENPENRARFAKDKLFVNGELQTKYCEPRLSDLQPAAALDTMRTITQSDTISEGGSMFTGFAAKVDSLHEISIVRQQLLLKDGVSDTSHIIMAYRLANIIRTIDNFSSDRDHGVGLELLKHMREVDVSNCVFFATRKCLPGFRHIGKKRFELVKQLCSSAFEKLET